MVADIDTTLDVIELITGNWRSQALYTAVKLKLPDHIEAGRTTSNELAKATGTTQDGIQRLMRLLTSIDVFNGNEQTGYSNTAMSGALIDDVYSLRDMCLLYGEECYTAWSHAHQAISSSSSGFEMAFGESFYHYLSQHEEVAKRFQNVMNTGSMFFDKVPEIFDFSGGKLVIDIGGGGGQLLATILSATPDAKGILFDQKHMIPKANQHLSKTIGKGRVQFISGDMFESIPTGGDVYMLSRVLAGWSDNAITQVLQKCRQGMANTSSKLLIFDRLIVDEKPTMLSALWDLQLMMTIGGRHRTLDNFVTLLNEAGFSVERIAELPMETTGIIATLNNPS